MTYYEIVTRLIGPIEAVGETNADKVRSENLDHMMELVDILILDIQQAANAKDRPEASMAAIGCKAQEYIDDLRESLEN